MDIGIHVWYHGCTHSGNIGVLSLRGPQWGYRCVVIEELTVGIEMCCH